MEGNRELTFGIYFEGNKSYASKQIPNYEWGQMHNYYAYCVSVDVFIDKGMLRIVAHNNAQLCLKD